MKAGCRQRLDPAKFCYLQSTTKAKSTMLCKNVQWLKVAENSACARESHRLQPFFSPRRDEMRQAVTKVRHTQKTMTAEQFVI